MPNESTISSFLNEVIEEQSPVIGDYVFYHFSVRDFYKIQADKDKHIARAISRGIKTEEQLIEEAIADNFWSHSDNDTIKSLKNEIIRYRKMADKTEDFITKNQFKNRINLLEDQIKDLDAKYQEIVSVSAESYAEQKSSLEIVGKFVVKNGRNIKHDEAVEIFSPFYSKLSYLMDEKLLVSTAYSSGFFEIYVLHEKNISQIFNKAGFELTLFQKNLILVAKNILNKLKNYDMPDHVKEDPMLILKYDDSKNSPNKKENMDDVKRDMMRGIDVNQSVTRK